MSLKDLLVNLPEVKGPAEKRVGFGVKVKWTIIILIFFFILSNIPLYGLSQNALSRFTYLSIILGASFGSLMSLGIGPIVTASIVLQLLVGSGLLGLDLKTAEGKKVFQGLQKILAVFFCIFEAVVYVAMKGLQAIPGMEALLVVQLFLGGVMVILMDEVISKWGFGNGVGLFIVGGVAWQLCVRAFGFLGPEKTLRPVGEIPVFIFSLINADTIGASVAFAAIAATAVIFIIVVYTQAIKVEVPLSFGRIRGFSVRWPLAFFYTSNIPVILAAALHANVNLLATLAERVAGNPTFLGGFTPDGIPVSGLAFWISSPPAGIVEHIIKGTFMPVMVWQSLIYILFMVAASVMFSVFWMKTSGMDPASQAEQITASGLQIPGFRRDPRVIETILSRYIMPLTVMGGAAVGLLASLADITGALVRGTGILLSVMIIYRLYEEIAQQHALDMHPLARKFIAT
ncbi:MAG: preprotein translocase subunit SecY [Candidatus Pacearchaeota archaeon]|nr:preprotein translocase subunit SecY [Candidatus Pacearchaeota archaeon]